MDPSDRLERLERALAQLAEDSHDAPVLVEGPNDARALRALGVRGEILVYNRAGVSILDTADRLRARKRLILLFDWDRKGGHLTRLMRDQLEGQVGLDLEIRRELASVSLVKCVEDLPHALENLRRRAEAQRAEPTRR